MSLDTLEFLESEISLLADKRDELFQQRKNFADARESWVSREASKRASSLSREAPVAPAAE